MNLKSLESDVDPVILARGREYLQAGRVRMAAAPASGAGLAVVQGTQDYTVTVNVAPDGTVVSTACDCPYDGGPVCKHVLAVLLKRRGGVPPLAAPPLPPLSDVVQAESAQRLASLLLDLAADSPMLADRIRTELTGEHEPVAARAEAARRRIQETMRRAADYEGFLDYHAVSAATETAADVSQEAEAAWEDGQVMLAIALERCLVHELAAAMERADDSDGFIGGLIDESLGRLSRVQDTDVPPLDPEDEEAVFLSLLEGAGDGVLTGWPDWQVPWLSEAAVLATSPERRAQWEAHAAAVLKRSGTGDEGYLIQEVTLLRYGLLAEYGEPASAEAYLREHLRLPALRELAIRAAATNQQFDEALRLARDGVNQDRERQRPGLGQRWKQLMYEVAGTAGRPAQQREIALELVTDGDVSYYAPLKDATDAALWPDVYHTLLTKLESTWHTSVYTQILIAEGETERLWIYCQAHPHEVDTLYPHLVPRYRAGVVAMMGELIEVEADRATTRAYYQQVCAHIHRMVKAGGMNEARVLVSQLKARYPRKPAFQEELARVERTLGQRP